MRNEPEPGILTWAVIIVVTCLILYLFERVLWLVVPGLLAISLPTPHSTTVTRVEKGAIIHEITVVTPEVEQGRGLVPAKINPVTGNRC